MTIEACRALITALLRAGCLAAFALASTATTTAAQGSYLNVGSRQAPLRLWLEEAGAGEPILFLHGLGANTYTWRYLVPSLARTHHLISVDLKGFGRSDKPRDEAYGVFDQARLIKVLIERKGLSKLTIVGHSFGGGVALALTADLNLSHPETVQRLVLIDSIAYPQRVPLFIELLRTPVLAEIGVFAAPPEAEAYKGLIAAYADPAKVSWEAVRAYARPLYEPGAREALIKTAQNIIPPNLPALIARYGTMQQPALLIWCAEDRVVPAKVGRKLARTLPHARLSLLAGCGHVPQEERPAATLALMRPFLAR